MRTRDLFPILLLAIMFAFTIYSYTQLPEQIPIHWNEKGVANGFGAKWTIFILPAITIIAYLVLLILPKYDVYKKNLEKCNTPIYWLTVLIVIFFILLHTTTILQAAGVQFNMNYVLIPLFGLFFIGIGFILPHIKRNFFIGIRSPWTLSSEKVWDKTHKVGGKVFIIAGALTLVSIVFINYALMIMVASLLIGSIGLVIYSYKIYKTTK